MSGMLRYHDVTYEILGAILRLGLSPVEQTTKSLATTVVASLDKAALAKIEAKDSDAAREIRRLIYYSRHKGYIDNQLCTTDSGLEKLAKLDFLQIKMTKPWDKKWRIVMYDIPETKSVARYHVRRLIKQLGFIQLQRSVWIHPLPCLEQFNRIKKLNDLKDNDLMLIETAEMNRMEKYLTHFRTVYPKL